MLTRCVNAARLGAVVNGWPNQNEAPLPGVRGRQRRDPEGRCTRTSKRTSDLFDAHATHAMKRRPAVGQGGMNPAPRRPRGRRLAWHSALRGPASAPADRRSRHQRRGRGHAVPGGPSKSHAPEKTCAALCGTRPFPGRRPYIFARIGDEM